MKISSSLPSPIGAIRQKKKDIKIVGQWVHILLVCNHARKMPYKNYREFHENFVTMRCYRCEDAAFNLRRK
jgi:hypothetical protein